MKTVLVALSLAFFPSPLLSQERKPVSTITEATWAEYQSMYGHSPLCEKQEVTLWSCETGKRRFALCSSQAVNQTSGYMQYRASKGGKVAFIFPNTKRQPLGIFSYQSSGNGDASVDFLSNGYRYSLIDPLRGHSSILVSNSHTPEQSTEIECGSNQTLQVNYTQRLMYDSGIWINH